jgi:NADP-dependent aldehyde dehydrogenase
VAEKGNWVDARIETAQPDRKPLPKPDHRSLNQPLGRAGDVEPVPDFATRPS